VTDKDAFVKACREMGFNGKVKENTTIRAFDGKTEKCALAINTGTYDIGLVEVEEGKYNLVSDWWGVRRDNMKFQNMSDDQLQNTVLQNTTKHTIKDKYEAIGFDVTVEPQKTGDMQITLTRNESRY